jgi:hypothetical protein
MRRSLMLCALVLAGCPGPSPVDEGPCPAPECPAPVPNASFEEGLSHNANQPEGWFGSDPTVFVQRVSKAADGDWAMELRVPADSIRTEPVELQTSRGILAAPGVLYGIGFAADVQAGNVTLTVEWRDDLNTCITNASGACQTDELAILGGPAGYRMVSAEVTAPSIPAQRRLYATLIFRAHLPRGSTAWLDVVRFTPR